MADEMGMEVDAEIDQYIEWLYDDATDSKIKAAKSILYLTISSQNLEYFAQHCKPPHLQLRISHGHCIKNSAR